MMLNFFPRRLCDDAYRQAPCGSNRRLNQVGEPKGFDFCAVFTMSLCAIEIKQMLISLLFQIARFQN